MTCVLFFFRLYGWSKVLAGLVHEPLKASAEWAVTAASSAKRRLRRYFIWTLEFAFSVD